MNDFLIGIVVGVSMMVFAKYLPWWLALIFNYALVFGVPAAMSIK